MQQTTINFTAQQVRARVSLADKVRGLYRSVNRWLDARSELCSRVAGFEVSCRQAIRMDLILLATMTAAVCTVQAPLVTAGSLAVAGWLVYRLNKEEKEAGHE